MRVEKFRRKSDDLLLSKIRVVIWGPILIQIWESLFERISDHNFCAKFEVQKKCVCEGGLEKGVFLYTFCLLILGWSGFSNFANFHTLLRLGWFLTQIWLSIWPQILIQILIQIWDRISREDFEFEMRSGIGCFGSRIFERLFRFWEVERRSGC